MPLLGFVVVVGLIGIALIQGLTIQEIGIPNVLSIKFADKSDEPKAGGGGPTIGGTSGNGQTDQPTISGDAVVTGSWVGRRGDLKLEVFEVENQDGHLLIHARVTNDANESVTLPVYGYFSASDSNGKTYKGDPQSDWPQEVPAGETVSGVIELEQRFNPGPATLNISFTHIFGFGAPSGGISVKGIALPTG